MKILHVTDHLPGYHKTWGGAEQVAYRYIKLLADSGKAEVLVGAVKPERKPNENFKYIRIRVIEDFFPEKLQLYITGIKNRIISFDPLSFFHLLMILMKEKPEIVHFHKANKISFSAVLAAKIAGTKTILGVYDYWYLCPGNALVKGDGKLCRQFHGSWCQECGAVTDFKFLLPFTAPIRRPIFDFFYRLIDKFAVLSDVLGRILVNYGIPKDKIFLVRQVFDFSGIKPTHKKTKKNMILFAGWIDPRKGVHILVEAMPKILKEVPKAKLYILKLEGIKDYEDKVMKKIKELKIKRNVNIYGRLSKEEFLKFLRQATMIVVPEQWENMSPVIIVEGMANGKVMVASRIGGIPEFIEDRKNGLLAKRDDPNDFAQKIIWVLENPKKAEKLGSQAAKDIVKLCDKRKVLKDLLKLYQSL